jgi:small conductance mechanosensitive channel
VNFDVIVDSARRLATAFLANLPRIALALILLLLFFIIARVVRSVMARTAQRYGGGHTLGLAMGRLAQAAIMLVGLLVAATAAFPSFTPANLVSALGIGGVAIGFAFKDIFQNFFAGVLILVTKPFQEGDQIVFKEFEGTVEKIHTRATYLKTYDGRRVVIPNGDLYANVVTVNTAFPTRRMQYDIGIGYDDDIERARAIVLGVLREVEGVLPDPTAEVVVVNLGESSVVLRARWWSDSKSSDVLLAQDKVLKRLKVEWAAAGIRRKPVAPEIR